MTAAFFAILTLAVIVAAVLLGRSRRARRWRHQPSSQQTPDIWPASLERFRPGAFKQARREVTEAAERAEEADHARRDAETSAQQHIAAVASLTTQLEVTSARVTDLEAASTADTIALNDATARAAALEAELTELQASDTGLSSDHRAEHDIDAAWSLLLARVERQWADVVNAGADERGVVDAAHGEQLAQAVQRDLERLREEVGVEATLARSQPVPDGYPLTTLLVVLEAAALLAYNSEHVTVDLRDPIVVSGQDWNADDNARLRLDQLAATAAAAGLGASVEVIDTGAQLVLDLRGTSTPAT